MAVEVGKLLYEKQLFELQGNTIAAERIQILIDKIIKQERDRNGRDRKRRESEGS